MVIIRDLWVLLKATLMPCARSWGAKRRSSLLSMDGVFGQRAFEIAFRSAISVRNESLILGVLPARERVDHVADACQARPAPLGGLPRRRTTRRGTRAGERRPPHTGGSDPRAQSAGRTNRRPNCQRGSSGFERSRTSSAEFGMVQEQVTPQGWLGSMPAGRRPQVRGLRAGGSLAAASSTPATQVLSPPKMLNLNHARNSRTVSPGPVADGRQADLSRNDLKDRGRQRAAAPKHS